MELIATARFKKAMDRATAASAYTDRISQVVADLGNAGLEVSHPLLEKHEETKKVAILVLNSNRGLCGGYNGNVLRIATKRHEELAKLAGENPHTSVSGKRGITGLKFRNIAVDAEYTEFEDQPLFEDVQVIAEEYAQKYMAGELDRLDVVFTKFVTSSRQTATVETILPLSSLDAATPDDDGGKKKEEAPVTTETRNAIYDFVPSAESILEEVVPMSFKVKLFKCFLDAAVSEQIARMVAMKSATDNASEMIRNLSITYNRARQSQITGEIMEIIGGVNALES